MTTKKRNLSDEETTITSYEFRDEHLCPTAILNYRHAAIDTFTRELRAASLTGDRSFLQAAHQTLSRRIQPVYSIHELQTASTTLAVGHGSCSQRMAVLEALARAAGIGTRSHALWIDGRFWYPRFPTLTRFMPRRVLIAWPEFALDGKWIGFEELYGPLSELAALNNNGFTNSNGETLFEAVGRTAVDWYGKTQASSSCTASSCDLSTFVVSDGGIFSSRDAAFAHYGFLLHRPQGCLFELLFGGRRAATVFAYQSI